MNRIKTFESFFMSSKQKNKNQLKEKAKEEINKFNFYRFLYQPSTEDSEQISKWLKSRFKNLISELPNVYKLFPDLFEGDNWKYIKIYADKYPNVTFVIPSKLYFIMNSDSFLDSEKGKKYFLNKIDEK